MAELLEYFLENFFLVGSKEDVVRSNIGLAWKITQIIIFAEVAISQFIRILFAPKLKVPHVKWMVRLIQAHIQSFIFSVQLTLRPFLFDAWHDAVTALYRPFPMGSVLLKNFHFFLILDFNFIDADLAASIISVPRETSQASYFFGVANGR